MTITITNADSALIHIIESLNKKLPKPYIFQCNDAPNEETKKALLCCDDESENLITIKDFGLYSAQRKKALGIKNC
ncbi:hypothetical protein [Helicobacter sp.]|uniref:hypothetical protein n=1 Tax=Helicobacter sp. TaxID=218 RepID=UPI00198A1D1F|nr:hypothetical protein [Helicobacter sp.]MBD5164368.1 hypothetical protein [Helicobacter sp.]